LCIREVSKKKKGRPLGGCPRKHSGIKKKPKGKITVQEVFIGGGNIEFAGAGEQWQSGAWGGYGKGAEKETLANGGGDNVGKTQI